MTNLVLLRELIRNDTARGHSDNVNSIFSWAGFGSLFGGVIVRASIPYSPIAFALFFSVVGVKTTHARSRLATDTNALTRRYTKTVGTAIRLEITPTRYPDFTSAIERARALAKRTAPQIVERGSGAVLDMVTRPTTFIHRDRMARTYLANAPSTVMRKRKSHSRKSRSPRSMGTFSDNSHTGTHSASDTHAAE